MQNRINFTQQYLDSIPLPLKGKRSYCYDARVIDLGISVTSKGSKSFIVYRKIDGIPTRVRLGKYPYLSIEQARRKALSCLSEIAAFDPKRTFIFELASYTYRAA